MLILLIQVIGAILTAFISLLLLKKDTRTTTEAIRKEALLVNRIIIAVTAVSILNLGISYYLSQNEKAQLVKDKKELKEDNADLMLQLSKNNTEQSKLITYQKQSARQLTLAANNLQHLINGSKEVPLFHFIMLSNKTLLGTVLNKDYKPVYNLSVRITNYDNLLQCKTKKAGVFDMKCFVTNTAYNPLITSLGAKNLYYLKLPKFNKKAQWGRYIITLTFNKKSYYEEAVYSNSQKHGLSQALRVIEYDDNAIIHKTIIKSNDYKLKYINWDKAFPLPLNLQLKKF
jgi:hypothetical protein